MKSYQTMLCIISYVSRDVTLKREAWEQLKRENVKKQLSKQQTESS